MNWKNRPWVKVLTWAAFAFALFLVATKVPFRELGPVLKRCRWEFLVGAVLVQYPLAYVQALRWKLLFQKQQLPLHKFLYFVFLGAYFNLFLPSSVLSEAGKVLAFGQKYGDLQENVGIALFNKAIGFFLQFALGVIGLILYAQEFRQKGISLDLHLQRPSLWFAAAIITVIGTYAGWRWLARGLKQTWARTFLDLARNKPMLVKTILLTAAIQLLSVLSGYLAFKSLYPEIHFWQIVFFSTIIVAVLLLPFSLGGLGVREYLNLLLYSDIGGIPSGIVFAANLLGYVPLLAAAATGFIWMISRRVRN